MHVVIDLGFSRKGRYVVNIKKMIAFVLSVCLVVVVTGCSGVEALPPETDLPFNEPVEKLENEDLTIEYEDIIEAVGFSQEYLNKEYGSFAEAYLDILAGNRSVLTDEHITGQEKRNGVFVGEGKIAVIDIFGDNTPELLCLYYTDPESGLYLKIFSYSETDGVESVFDNVIYECIGGENNYCVYITRDGELMMFLWSSGGTFIGGFWPIMPNQIMEYDPYPLDGFVYSSDLAALCYIDIPVELYMQYGKAISLEQFNKASKEIMGNIDSVLFQGAVLGELGLRLYKDVELWRDITPFEEKNMTYNEAIAWLEAQIDKR